jgi:hypothetical protein
MTDNHMIMMDLPPPRPAASAASGLDRMNTLVDAFIPTANNVRNGERAAHVGVRVTAIPLPIACVLAAAWQTRHV